MSDLHWSVWGIVQHAKGNPAEDFELRTRKARALQSADERRRFQPAPERGAYRRACNSIACTPTHRLSIHPTSQRSKKAKLAGNLPSRFWFPCMRVALNIGVPKEREAANVC